VRAGRVARAALLVRGKRCGLQGVWRAPLVGKIWVRTGRMQTPVRTRTRCRPLAIDWPTHEAGSRERFCLPHGSIDAARGLFGSRTS
jgi:hypothetical protein